MTRRRSSCGRSPPPLSSKAMLHRQISYAALIAAAIVFQIFFRFYLSTFTLVLVAALPVLSVLLTLPALLGSTLRLTSEGQISRGGEGHFTLRLERKNTLPLPPVRVRLTWSNQLTGERGTLACLLRSGDGTDQLSLSLPAPHCGQLVCAVERAAACDLLGLFPLPLPGRAGAALLLLPLPAEVTLPAELDAPRTGGAVLRPRPGGGPGEDYDLREYRAGDPLRSIHWKLSSKKGDLVVRETLEPRQAELILTYDHFGSPEELDQVFDRLCTLSRLLLAKGRSHRIQWAAPVSGEITDREVDSERSLMACLELAFSLAAPPSGRSILDGALKMSPSAGLPLHFHVTARDVKGGRK